MIARRSLCYQRYMVNTETGFAKNYRTFNHKIVFLMVRYFKMSDIAQKKCDVKEEVTI